MGASDTEENAYSDSQISLKKLHGLSLLFLFCIQQIKIANMGIDIYREHVRHAKNCQNPSQLNDTKIGPCNLLAI